MPIPTHTAQFLEELIGGAFANQIDHALSEVAAGGDRPWQSRVQPPTAVTRGMEHQMNTARNDDQIEFIRLPEVKKLVSLGTTKIYTMAKIGLFPKQVRLGGRAVAWIKSEVLQWSNDQIAAARGQRDQAPASSESK
ncbi:AlpA family phage regulatory protein [Pseudomonas sp. SIMBA_041]|uniref:helix-turn-helix transcriptional regulator n=1 Tax=Pseudomonas sp. SIMBA_041 TaxID=3085782 RepID=UPI00397AD66D